ncbi:Protein GLUTAMINE DUMPER 3 [Abeliophyllum distichum]|uniref:Protein GLUTAMINE DUMPER 3 n=1 Tax=Abeliophyllum distichum TaxID=126358 RepID=A0ABD1V3S8_9LAMI
MKPAVQNSSITAGGGVDQWNTSIPYFFGTLGLMLGLIVLSLIILACLHRKSSNYDAAEENPTNPLHLLHPQLEPKINVVIMAGETNPTFLANPVPSTRDTTQPH